MCCVTSVPRVVSACLLKCIALCACFESLCAAGILQGVIDIVYNYVHIRDEGKGALARPTVADPRAQGNVMVVGRKSQYSLYDEKIASFEG